KKGKQAISIIASIPSIPNFTLFMSLIRYLRQAAPLPAQDGKNERNAPPEKLQQATALIKSGDQASGRKLLFEVIGSDPGNETAWLWLVSVVSPDYRIFCLEKALSINPGNVQARQYLEKLEAGRPNKPVKSKTGSSIKPAGNIDARLSGSFILLLGLGLGYWQIFLPIKNALRHVAYISYSPQMTMVASLAIFMGLFLLVFGSEGLVFLSKPSSKLGAVLLIIGVFIVMFGCYFGMEYVMKSLGYH
ncbi:MAG: hypothetical protein AB1750_15650, partial [Chloroflexota bacterium]